MRLDGRVALVSGSGRGIGRAIAWALAECGAQVAVNYVKRDEPAHELVREIQEHGGTASAHRASVSNADECRAMVTKILDDHGHIDILVNNAGVSNRPALVVSTELDDLARAMETTAYGSYHLAQLVLPSMREQPRGDIVMISSQSAVQHHPYGAPYNMAKAAQESLAFTLAREEAKHGIRVNVVVPGLTNTDLGAKVAKGSGVDDIHELNHRFPLGRVTEPEDIAHAVRFLVSAGAEHITGQRLVVDGGGFG
jgi:NAD(P)-dependent dehydrogenase (short-subunit alcohol dehydrogenase family)